MKTLNVKNIGLAVIISVTAMMSLTVNAKTNNTLEGAVSEYVVAQSQQLMTEINKQLKQTIENEIKAFSISLPVASQHSEADESGNKGPKGASKEEINQVKVK